MPGPQKTRGAPSATMLTVEGQVSVTDSFFEQVREAVKTAVEHVLSDEMTSLREMAETTAKPRPEPVDAKPQRQDLDLAEGDQARARAALQQRGIDLGIEKGRALIDTKAMSRLLSISMRTFHKLLTTGAVPKPLTFGRVHRWPLEEVLAWVDSGCPPADRWGQIRKAALREYRASFSTNAKTGR